jgi:abortive infection bacteriophage resistance protein
MMELFSFGMLAFFFEDMHQSDKKEIAEKHFGGRFSARHIESWLSSLAELRNQCAHYCRLYDNNIKPAPKSLEDAPFDMAAGGLFSFIYVIRLLYIKRAGGESNLALHLRTLIEEYSDVIELRVLGFPEEWEEILR